MKTIKMSYVNGVGYVKENGVRKVPRFVIERNVLDMLEDNDKYMNLDFCDAQCITELASVDELLRIYEYEMSAEEFARLAKRILG